MAPFGNLPEVVIYTEFGVEHKALVIGARELEHHAGENNEPLLHLVIVKPMVADACANCSNRRVFHGKPAPAHLRVCGQFVEPDPQPVTDLGSLVQVVPDVAHESHKFSDDQIQALAKQGIVVPLSGRFTGGRWREADAGGIPIPNVVPVEGGAIAAPAAEPAVSELSKEATADTSAKEPEKDPTIQ